VFYKLHASTAKDIIPMKVLEIVEAIKKFNSYLLGRHLKIIGFTDRVGFTKTLEKREL